MKYKISTVCMLLFLFGIMLPCNVLAQNNDESKHGLVGGDEMVFADKIPSLFFTYWQYRSILDAKFSRGFVRKPTQAELDAMESLDEDFVPDKGVRYISLGGISYKDKDNWVVWLNGERITPVAIPKEVLDLRVFNDYIEIKWLDDYTNQIFPIRMRTNQRFNLDMRIFLPG